MDADGGAETLWLRTEQLDGPRHGVVVGDALVAPRPIELVDVLARLPSGLVPKMRSSCARGSLVVEMQAAAAGDGVGLTIAHVPADSRHALLRSRPDHRCGCRRR